MKRLFYLIPLFLLFAGCSKRTENNASGDTPIETYRKGIDRVQEVQQKSNERAKNLYSIFLGISDNYFYV